MQQPSQKTQRHCTGSASLQYMQYNALFTLPSLMLIVIAQFLCGEKSCPKTVCMCVCVCWGGMISYNVTVSCSNAKFETQSPLPRGVPWIAGHAAVNTKIDQPDQIQNLAACFQTPLRVYILTTTSCRQEHTTRHTTKRLDGNPVRKYAEQFLHNDVTS